MNELDQEIARARILMPIGAEDSILSYQAENAGLKARIVFLETLPLHGLSMRVLRYKTKVRRWRWRLAHPWDLRRRIAKRIYDWDLD